MPQRNVPAVPGGSNGTDGISTISRRRAAARTRSGAAYTRRRAEIIAASAEVFRSKGYQASTLVDVAEAVGVDRASLYFYVRSKEEIFEEIVTELVIANVASVELIARSECPAPEKLRRLIAQVMGAYAEHYPFLYVYLQENLANVPDERRDWAVKLRSVNRRYEAAVKAVIEQGIADGTLRAVADLSVVANGLMGMMSWTHRWFNPRRTATSADEIARAYADIWLAGLEPPREVSVTTPTTAAGGDPPVLHPDVVRIAAKFEAANVATYDVLTVAEARIQLEAVTKLQRPPVELAHVEDIQVPGATGPLPARVYRPAAEGPLPVVVYLHGGGWVLGSIRAADEPCRALADRAGCVVVSLDYRRAPETKFPGPLDDCVSAVRWVAANADQLGGSGRLVLFGDSAGGNLAAASCAVLRDASEPIVDAQILLYPTLAPAGTTDFDSYRRYADGPLMTRRELDWFWDHYLRTAADGSDPLAAPLHTTEFAGLPDTTVIVAQCDPLHDEGVAYAHSLEAAGVPTRVIDVAGAAHGFWWMDRVLAQADELTDTLVPLVRGD